MFSYMVLNKSESSLRNNSSALGQHHSFSYISLGGKLACHPALQ